MAGPSPAQPNQEGSPAAFQHQSWLATRGQPPSPTRARPRSVSQRPTLSRILYQNAWGHALAFQPKGSRLNSRKNCRAVMTIRY